MSVPDAFPVDSTDDAIQVLAGDCTVSVEGDQQELHRGAVVVLRKPDDTVLVHDADGYRPLAWITRADAVTTTRDGGFALTAVTDGRRLRVVARREYGFGQYPATATGPPVGDCPDCSGTLVRSRGAISCLDCSAVHGLPADASVLDERCGCGLPRIRVERGAPFEVCADRSCEPLDDAVRERFDREWGCPDCDGDLRILRRGGLLAGCERYPDCETAFVVPAGVLDGTCGCGLPSFRSERGQRCLDSGCDVIASA